MTESERRRALAQVACPGEGVTDSVVEEEEEEEAPAPEEPAPCYTEPEDDCDDCGGQMVRKVTNSSPVTDTEEVTDSSVEEEYRDNPENDGYEDPNEANNNNCCCPCDQEEGEGGYFFVVDKNGIKPDNNAEDFFEIMNERAGGIFEHDKETGLVMPTEGATPDEVTTSETESKILAKLIYDCTMDKRTEENPKIAPQTKSAGRTDKDGVRFRIVPEENDEINNKFYFDWFRTGFVDMTDNTNMLEKGEDAESEVEQEVQENIGVRKHYTEIMNYEFAENEIVQAGVFGHYIYERFSFKHYEKHKKRVKNVESTRYHDYGQQKEIEIMLDMLNAPNRYKQNIKHIKVEMEVREINEKDYLVVSYIYNKSRVIFEYFCEILMEEPRKKIKNLNFVMYHYAS